MTHELSPEERLLHYFRQIQTEYLKELAIESAQRMRDVDRKHYARKEPDEPEDTQNS